MTRQARVVHSLSASKCSLVRSTVAGGCRAAAMKIQRSFDFLFIRLQLNVNARVFPQHLVPSFSLSLPIPAHSLQPGSPPSQEQSFLQLRKKDAGGCLITRSHKFSASLLVASVIVSVFSKTHPLTVTVPSLEISNLGSYVNHT